MRIDHGLRSAMLGAPLAASVSTMAIGRVEVDQLLAAVIEHLANRPAGAASRYDDLMALAALRIVARELESGAATAEAERLRLAELLRSNGALDELNAELCRRIRQRALTYGDIALLRHLELTAIERLAIDNPRYPALRLAQTRCASFNAPPRAD